MASQELVPVADVVSTGPPSGADQLATAESAVSGYGGASMLVLTKGETDLLATSFGDDALDVKPTGEVFVSHVHYRRRLNAVFGPGQWALVPRGKWTVDGNTMMREYALYARGHFIAEAVGEQEYIPNNERMSWADAAEGCKSNALTRACKDLGIASECWDRQFAQHWRAKNCLQVWVDGRKRPQWRRKDALPFFGEGRPVEDSAARGEGREPGADDEGLPADPDAYERHGVEPPAKPAPKGPGAPCPSCGKPAGPSKFPKAGKTHYCYPCKHAFEPEPVA